MDEGVKRGADDGAVVPDEVVADGLVCLLLMFPSLTIDLGPSLWMVDASGRELSVPEKDHHLRFCIECF